MKVWVCIIETVINGEHGCTVDKVVASQAQAEAWCIEPPAIPVEHLSDLEGVTKWATHPIEVEGMQ